MRVFTSTSHELTCEWPRSGDGNVMNRPNASYSRTYLTRENYRGATLLRSIRGEESRRQLPSSMMKTDVREDESLIYAPPDSSSSDEDDQLARKPPTQSKSKTPKPPSPSTKRAASTAASNRPKRQKLRDEPALDTLKALEDSTLSDPFPGWTSSGSQKRKPSKNYANRKFFQKLEPIESMTEPGAKGTGFVSYAEVEEHEEKASKTTFIRVAEVPALPVAKGKTKAGQKMTIPSLPTGASESKRAEIQIPELLDFSSSGGTDHLASFDVDSPRGEGRERSGSTSSLSSVDDMFLLVHNDEFKVEPEPRSAGVCCPVCQRPVRDTMSVFVPDNLRTMPFQQQQKFCSQHRLADARGQWEDRGYPKLDWEKLETFRIPKKTQELGRVISRESSSYYLDQLDAKIKAAKGNRRTIRNYLNEGLIDIAKPGYYGPKGARIIVQAITESLSKTLNKALQSDPALRAAGVGAYVSAVLVPELTLQLVMEDMKLPTAKEGRKVLDESTDIGVLLNPDDDHVEREHDGEND
ncbi:RTC4-like domain-containing protein [Cladophialophora immunda]|nr:RTC4-like domain-containing protein [Cladophialophora immunda]